MLTFRLYRGCMKALVAASVVAGATVLSASAYAAGPARPLDTAIFPGSEATASEGPLAFRRARLAGTNAVRVVLRWSSVAPMVRPAGFRPEDPADPAYRWDEFDRRMVLAARNGLEPLVTVLVAPRWAQAGVGKPQGNERPDATELGRFATAAARRYSGSFRALPRVRYWMAWNEPNLNHYIEPQLVQGRVASAQLYRQMVNEFARAVHRVHRDNVVIAGGLSPFTITAPAHVAVGPLRFMRELLCMSGEARPRPTCDAKVEFDVWSHHPYTSGGPTRQAAHPDDVSIGDLPEMRRLLTAAVQAGHVVSRGSVRFWITEFSWDTKPPDVHPLAMPLRLHSRWVAEALYRMWKSGVSLVTWLTLRDQPYPTSPLQSGLYFYGGRTLTRDLPKPSLTAFRFPFVAFRARRGVNVWGRTPWGRPGSVVVERRTSARWVRVAVVRTDRYGIFSRVLPAATAARTSAPARSVESTSARYGDTVLGDRPRSYWRLGEIGGVVARDERGVNSGTYGGSPARIMPGALTAQSDGAVRFDGVDDLVTLGPVSSPRTIELWLKTTTTEDVAAFSNRTVFHENLYLGVWGGLAHLFHTNSPFHLFSEQRANDDRWHHVVYTFSGLRGTLYVDGKLSMTGIWDPVGGRSFGYLGYDPGTRRFFKGALDEVAIYDHALTGKQVQKHFLASGRRLAPNPDIGSLRARIVGTRTTSLPFSLKRHRDRFVIPFGGGGSR